MASASPRAILIAGPNGAGKTTFAREFLPAEGNCPTFINADLIAQGLSPFRPETMAVEASRLMLERVRQMAAERQDFAVETTLAGRAYLRMIREWQGSGYQVELMFLQLPSADLAVERARQRVAQGGHNIPEPVIRRRFVAALKTSMRSIATLSMPGRSSTPAGGRLFCSTMESIHDSAIRQISRPSRQPQGHDSRRTQRR